MREGPNGGREHLSWWALAQSGICSLVSAQAMLNVLFKSVFSRRALALLSVPACTAFRSLSRHDLMGSPLAPLPCSI